MTDEPIAQVVKKDELLKVLKPLFQQPEKPKSNFIYWLATLLVLSSFLFFGAVAFYPIQCDSNVVFYLLGATTTVLSTIVTYFFGSSSGSNDKNAVFKDLANTAMENAKRQTEYEEDR